MEYASRIAPEIDRLVLAVNETVGDRIRTPATEMAQELGLDRPGALKHYAEFLLFARLDEAVAVARLPYRPASQTAAEIERWRRLGLVEGPPGAMVATERSEALLRLMLDTGRDVATSLWDAHRGSVDEASAIAAHVIDDLDDEFAVARAHRTVPLPGDPYQRLHRRLTTIRYARAWAHVTAWRARGFDLEEIKVLTTLWQGGESGPGPVVAALAERGLVDGDGTGLTEPGIAIREAIERSTNELARPVFEAVDDTDRERLLALLARLPGERR